MAIAIRADKPTAIADSASALTITKPSGIANDDVLVCFMGLSNNISISPPAGWTTLDMNLTAAGSDKASGIFYKKITDASSEGANYTFTASGSESLAGGIVALTGVDTTTQSDVANSFSSGENWAGTEPCDEVTTVTDGALALTFFFAGRSASSVTHPAGTDLVWFVDNGSASIPYGANVFVSSFTQGTAGLTGDKLWAATFNTPPEWHAYQCAFRPAAGGSPEISGNIVISDITIEGALNYTPPSYTISGDIIIPEILIEGTLIYTPPAYSVGGNIVILDIDILGTLIYTPPPGTIGGDIVIPDIDISGTLIYTPPAYSVGGDIVISDITIEGALNYTPPSYTISGDIIIPEILIDGILVYTPPLGVIIGDIVIPDIDISGTLIYTPPTSVAPKRIIGEIHADNEINGIINADTELIGKIQADSEIYGIIKAGEV